MMAAVALVAAGLGALTTFVAVTRRAAEAPPVPAPVIRFEVPGLAGEPSWVTIPPDGQSIAWGEVSRESKRPMVMGRRHSGTSNIAVAAAEGALAGQFRRNSTDLFVGRRGELSSIGADEQILVGLDGAIIRIIAARPDDTKVMATPDPKVHEWYADPQWLPGGDRMLFVARRAGGRETDALVMPVAGGAPSRLDLPADITHVLVNSKTEAIVHARGSTLLGQRVDCTAPKTADEPVTLAAQVLVSAETGALTADLSDSDELAYRRPGPRADKAPVDVVVNRRQLLK